VTKSAAIVLSLTCFACATRSLAVAPDCGDGQADAEAALALGDTPQFTEEPRLLNLRQLVQALAREYPPQPHGEVGARETVLVRIFITEEGCVGSPMVVQGSGSAEMDRAVLRAIVVARFDPARNGDQKVGIWFELPISTGRVSDRP